ncbi:unnamed protein product, partial [Musa acuminata subsp. burmannicoides]
RASTRVSSGFASLRHSSPSFGSRHACSNSNPSQKIGVGRRCNPSRGFPPVSFLVPSGFPYPSTRTHVRLLGPCFKTGRMGALAMPRSACTQRDAPMARVMSSTASTVSPRTNDPSGLRPSMQPASIRTPSRAADRLTAVPHPTEVHRRPPSASLPAISSTL